MKKYASWIALGVMALAGLTVSLYFAIQPRAIPKIQYSQFTSPQEMAWAIGQRLRLEIKQADLVFLGVEPQMENQLIICQSLMDQLKKEGNGFDVIVMDPHLDFRDRILHQEEMDIKTEMERFVQGVQKAKESHQRVAVIVPSLYGTYLIEATPASQILQKYNIRALTFTMSSFPTRREEENLLLYPCVPDQEDRLGSRNLGCMILASARTTYRKRYQGPKHPGMMDQVGLTEYLVLYN